MTFKNQGRGIIINLTGDEVATAIDAYLVAHQVVVRGPRTVKVNGQLCKEGKVYVDPTGFVIIPSGAKLEGRGVELPPLPPTTDDVPTGA